ncbi:unnamed protein product [Allacma fusca]|uniref:Uncharacterized protein n=1 Tax=Allacma fusca TaxID=39272 RepID=A0A8J2LV47_9HEXA|nr:unnamed protein product [Allacma fusca]
MGRPLLLGSGTTLVFSASHRIPAANSTFLMGAQGTLILVNIFSHLSNVPAIEGNVTDYYTGVGATGGELTSVVLRKEELFIFRRNLIALIICCCYISQGLMSSIIFYVRRDFVCYFLSFILEAAEMTKINIAYGAKRFMWSFVGFWMICATMLLASSVAAFAPITGGVCSLMATMSYRVFYPPIHAIEHSFFRVLRGCHGLVLMLILVNAEVNIILFVWCCRLIRNGFVTWNGRVDRVLLRDEQNKSDEEREIHRTKLGQMFTDHVVLLDLTQGVDRVFAGIVEMYYFSRVISVGFGLYFLVRIMLEISDEKSPSEKGREFDILILLVFNTVAAVLLYHVTMAPAEINDEALEGFEVIRRRGFMGKKSDDELYFILSMYVSYTGHYEIAVVCGNYFTMDKSLFIVFLSSMCVYFVLMCQLQIPITLSERALRDLEVNLRLNPNKIIWQTEGPYF